MRVLGVDQSYTNFGFSIDGESKKRQFPLAKYDNEVHRLYEIREWWEHLLDLHLNAGIDLVVMEGYANAAKHGREMSGELGGLVKLSVYTVLDQVPLVVPPNSLKKFVSGSGAAKKNTMIAHVYRQWGHMFSDDNQADAYALEQFGKAYLYLQAGKDPEQYPLHKYQVEAIRSLKASS